MSPNHFQTSFLRLSDFPLRSFSQLSFSCGFRRGFDLLPSDQRNRQLLTGRTDLLRRRKSDGLFLPDYRTSSFRSPPSQLLGLVGAPAPEQLPQRVQPDQEAVEAHHPPVHLRGLPRRR